MLSRQHETTLEIPVVYKNFPVDLILAEEPLGMFKVRVKSPGFSIVSYSLFNFSQFSLDFTVSNSKYIHNKQEFFWLMNSKRKRIADMLGGSMEIINIEPQRLAVLFDNKDKKKIPIILEEDIRVRNGFWHSKPITLNPDSVMIYGAEPQLDTIDAIYTDLLSLQNVSKHQKSMISLKQIDGVQSKISDIEVSLWIEPFIEENITKKITVINLNKGCSVKLFPEKVAVTLRVPKNKYKLLKTDLFDLEIDAGEMSPEMNVLEVSIQNLPSYMEIQRIYPERVEYLLIKE